MSCAARSAMIPWETKLNYDAARPEYNLISKSMVAGGRYLVDGVGAWWPLDRGCTLSDITGCGISI